MQFSPRSRAKRIYPRIRTWPQTKEPKLLGFAGYKAGMTHTLVFDPSKTNSTAGTEVFTPVTVLECPPLFPFLLRVYEKTPYGFKSAGDIWAPSPKLSKDLSRKITLPKKTISEKDLKGTDVSLVVHTQPRDASALPKKKPEIFEIAVGGQTFEEKLNFAKQLLGKPIRASELFKPGEFLDVSAVTTGKGVEGVITRFGVKIQRAKAQRSGKGRHVGSRGARGSPTRWQVPSAGQYGYNVRTEYNKRILKIGAKGEDITPKGGFVNYGIVQNDFIVLKGSVPGHVKRLIRLKPALRMLQKKVEAPQITYLSLTSKQGR